MNFSRGNLPRTDLGKSTPNSSDADVIFIRDWAQKYPAKIGASLAEMTPKGFQKLQSGENTISYKKLTKWLQRDDDFRVAYFQQCGGKLLTDPQTAVALGRALNAVARGDFSE